MKKLLLDGKTIQSLCKNHNLILILVAMIFLVFSFMGGDDNKDEAIKEMETSECITDYDDVNTYIKKQEEKLENMLNMVEGVGKAEVMITVSTSVNKNVLKEKQYEKQSDGTDLVYSEDVRTVYVNDEAGNEIPYVINEEMPKIEGVLVVAQGADDIYVKEKIINIIKALFAVNINKISVTK